MVQHFTFPFSYSLRPGNHICCLATVLWQYHNLGVTTMRDTVAMACQVERDAVQGGWLSLQDAGWPSVPGDMGWLLWHGICCTPTVTSLSGHSPLRTRPWSSLGGSMHNIPSWKSLMRHYPPHCVPLLPQRQPSHKQKNHSKNPSLERHYFPHKEMFLYKEQPCHVHTQIFLPLSTFIVWRQFMTPSRNFPHAPFIQMLSTFKFTHHCRNSLCWEAVHPIRCWSWQSRLKSWTLWPQRSCPTQKFLWFYPAGGFQYRSPTPSPIGHPIAIFTKTCSSPWKHRGGPTQQEDKASLPAKPAA